MEDWKAIYWMILWGGEKPSTVSKVIIENQNGFCYIWHESIAE